MVHSYINLLSLFRWSPNNLSYTQFNLFYLIRAKYHFPFFVVFVNRHAPFKSSESFNSITGGCLHESCRSVKNDSIQNENLYWFIQWLWSVVIYKNNLFSSHIYRYISTFSQHYTYVSYTLNKRWRYDVKKRIYLHAMVFFAVAMCCSLS